MAQQHNVAVILSGCGVFDGSEIHEAVMILLALDRLGASYQCFAPDTPQAHVINHLRGEVADGESRNVLVEAARIARGEIKALSEFNAADFDAIAFPGGFGAAKNLSTFAFDGAECTVNTDVERALKDMVAANKPIGALCITPAIIARVLDGANVTIGSDKDTATAIEAMGAKHTVTTHGEVVVDPRYKLVTTPCYMLDATVSQIADGAMNAMTAMLDLVEK
ncbi:MAG: isoprenoid biosynthesis glyoxalase ElbB [Sphingomonadales bacterium]|nr:isoprenoid biosynthesis glyoxalase ElbB [Sphingomonadales bacterium]